VSATGRSRGPWLASGLFCPAGSSLTMASSAALALSRPFLDIGRVSALRPRVRASPIYSACPSFRAVFPARRVRRCLTVPNPPTLAFAACPWARHPAMPHAKVGSRVGVCFELQSSLDAAARKVARPAPTGAFTFELSRHSSPPGMSNMTTRANSQFPAAGLAPAGQAALWAARTPY
jgi:hypothetical protein